MKHVSHYVQPGAYKLETEGAYTNLLAFRNPDNSIALIIANETSDDHSLSIRIGDRVYTPIVKAYSMNTLLVIDYPFERCKKTSCQLSLRIFVHFVRNIVSRTRVNSFGTLFA